MEQEGNTGEESRAEARAEVLEKLKSKLYKEIAALLSHPLVPEDFKEELKTVLSGEAELLSRDSDKNYKA